jgi:DNA-binding FadR family transcriptional regulator
MASKIEGQPMDLKNVTVLSSPNRRSLADQLYSDLRERIRSGELPPGERLPTEKGFTEAFGVSRTTVREALARLAADGMVQARQGIGVYVTETANYEAFQISRDELETLEDVTRLLELRLAIETEMAGLAATRRTAGDIKDLRRKLSAINAADTSESAARADADFHASIARTAHNVYFERILDFIGTRLVPPRTLVMHERGAKESGAYASLLDAEHRAIVDAIEAGNGNAASTAMRRHLSESLSRHRAVASA